MIILGIDPGTATTGYGFVKINNLKSKNKKELSRLSFDSLQHGVIKTDPALTTPERLKKISNDLNKLIRKHQPQILAIENVYFFKNLKTALPVSQAKGVILLAAAKKKIPVYEFTPLQVKKTITNYGWAEKQKVQKKIRVLLKLKGKPLGDDVADALAIAVCCAKFLEG